MMTDYQKLMDQHDYYIAEARKHPSKAEVFRQIAEDYKRKALSLTIEEASR